MIAGKDFPSMFSRDNFTSRRTSGHNMFDPESLLTGAEIAAGFTFGNSARNWPSEVWYTAAWAGELTREEILELAPRVMLGKHACKERV